MSKCTGAIICSFSTSIIDLKGAARTDANALECLRRHPRISTFDFSEHYKWLQPIINRLLREGKIAERKLEYPWHGYTVLSHDGEKHE